MHTRSSLHGINHELNVAHLPICITHELLAETDGIGDVGEAEDDGADLGVGVIKFSTQDNNSKQQKQNKPRVKGGRKGKAGEKRVDKLTLSR
jgi:hypothetical protein